MVPENTTAILLCGLLFSAFGMGYAVYGKRQQALVPLLSGIALMIYPYFVDGLFWLVTLGLALLAAPIVLRR